MNVALAIGGAASALASALHVAIVFGGPRWYLFFGAGPGMARAAEAGRWQPAAITFGVAAGLGTWAAYAFAGAGLIDGLPLVRPALVAITAVYLLRGAVLLPALLRPGIAHRPFLLWSSGICLAIGAVHLAGLVQRWQTLGA